LIAFHDQGPVHTSIAKGSSVSPSLGLMWLPSLAVLRVGTRLAFLSFEIPKEPCSENQTFTRLKISTIAIIYHKLCCFPRLICAKLGLGKLVRRNMYLYPWPMSGNPVFSSLLDMVALHRNCLLPAPLLIRILQQLRAFPVQLVRLIKRLFYDPIWISVRPTHGPAAHLVVCLRFDGNRTLGH